MNSIRFQFTFTFMNSDNVRIVHNSVDNSETSICKIECFVGTDFIRLFSFITKYLQKLTKLLRNYEHLVSLHLKQYYFKCQI